MLVLTRKKGQSIKIGDNIEISIMDVEEDKVSIGIVAPRNIEIVRTELLDVKNENITAANAQKDGLDKLRKFFTDL
ncbi:MAG: carbon storage regulator [Thermoanaerobacteraceae bacterium]|nr:carbon storage regulator [Thermoanaerobacteraceae bacterium]